MAYVEYQRPPFKGRRLRTAEASPAEETFLIKSALGQPTPWTPIIKGARVHVTIPTTPILEIPKTREQIVITVPTDPEHIKNVMYAFDQQRIFYNVEQFPDVTHFYVPADQVAQARSIIAQPGKFFGGMLGELERLEDLDDMAALDGCGPLGDLGKFKLKRLVKRIKKVPRKVVRAFTKTVSKVASVLIKKGPIAWAKKALGKSKRKRRVQAVQQATDLVDIGVAPASAQAQATREEAEAIQQDSQQITQQAARQTEYIVEQTANVAAQRMGLTREEWPAVAPTPPPPPPEIAPEVEEPPPPPGAPPEEAVPPEMVPPEEKKGVSPLVPIVLVGGAILLFSGVI